MIAPFLALALAASPAPAAASDPVAQALVEQLSHGLAPAEVGQWVTYRLNGGSGAGAFWRLAVVSRDRDAKGRDAVWVEMEASQTAKMVAPLMQMRMLVARKNGLDPDAISRVIVAAGMGKPQEVDPAALARIHTPAPRPGEPEDVPFHPEQTHLRAGKAQPLMTMAGTVTAMPVELMYRDTVVQRFWVSKQIPVLQLAKIEIPGVDTSLEVRDYGLDAKPMMRLPDPSETKLTFDAPKGDDHAPSQP